MPRTNEFVIVFVYWKKKKNYVQVGTVIIRNGTNKVFCIMHAVFSSVEGKGGLITKN